MPSAPVSLNPPKPVNYARLARKAWLIAVCVFIAACFFPIRSSLVRGRLVTVGLFVWAGALFLFWRRLPVRVLCLALALAPLLLLFVPDRPIHTENLRSGYVAALQNYENTPYVWGGETTTGIDCSGLTRAALCVAELRQGVRTTNMALLRKSASLWWNDGSASDLAAGYQGRTLLLGKRKSLNGADYAPLAPGDLAVTEDGKHVLAYEGNKKWIEADPNAGKVVRVTIPSQEHFFNMHMTLVRWRVLENANAAGN